MICTQPKLQRERPSTPVGRKNTVRRFWRCPRTRRGRRGTKFVNGRRCRLFSACDDRWDARVGRQRIGLRWLPFETGSSNAGGGHLAVVATRRCAARSPATARSDRPAAEARKAAARSSSPPRQIAVPSQASSQVPRQHREADASREMRIGHWLSQIGFIKSAAVASLGAT